MVLKTMRLVLDTDPKILTVRRYTSTELDIAGEIVRRPCLLSAQRLIVEWPVTTVAALEFASLAPALALHPTILLLGTSESGVRAPSLLRRELEARGIAVEVMDLGAACRTYNVLAQELRAVVAGLFPSGAPEEDTGRKSLLNQPTIRS